MERIKLPIQEISTSLLPSNSQTDPRWIFILNIPAGKQITRTRKTCAEWQGGKVTTWQRAGEIIGEVEPHLH